MDARQVLIKTMHDVQGVAKKDKNTSQNFNFRGIDAVLNAVGPALRNNGGFIVPTVLDKSNELLPTRSGGSQQVVRLTVQFAVYGDEGEPIVGVVASEAFDSGDKATAKAMSVAFRTFLLQALALPTDEPDPDTFSYEIGQKPAVGSAPADTRIAKAQAEITAAKTQDELKAIWTAVADIADAEVNTEYGVFTLKELIIGAKERLNA